MKHGPVLSCTLNAMNKTADQTSWQEIIAYMPYEGGESNTCSLQGNMDATEYLSGYEIEILDSVWSEFGHMDKWTLRELTHTFHEWDPICAEKNTSRPIQYADIFEKGYELDHDLSVSKAEAIEYYEAVHT
jgi:uncharacterized phage-associated protein